MVSQKKMKPKFISLFYKSIQPISKNYTLVLVKNSRSHLHKITALMLFFILTYFVNTEDTMFLILSYNLISVTQFLC